MIGWRKLAAWFLCFALVSVSTWTQRDIPPNAKEVLIWASGFFFVVNGLKPLAQNFKVAIGQAISAPAAGGQN